MDCPHCNLSNTYARNTTTTLGYQEYRCQKCNRQFNERTGTVFNFIEYPTEIVVMTVIYYYQFKTSLDDVVKLMLMRGVELSHQTVLNWSLTVGIELALEFRKRRRGKAAVNGMRMQRILRLRDVGVICIARSIRKVT